MSRSQAYGERRRPLTRVDRFGVWLSSPLGLSAAIEVDDHKRYHDPRDLWPMLVRAGFRPSQIRCYRHKFGLNTFAACCADAPLEQDEH